MSNNEIIEIFLNHNDPIARRKAIESLSKNDLTDKELIPLIINGLKDDDIGVKDSTARLLSAQIEDIAIEINNHILPFIVSDDIELRNLAAEILKSTGIYSPSEFIPYFNHEDFRVKQFAIDIVRSFKSDDLKPNLIELLNDNNENVRSSAIDALGNYGDENLLEILISRFDFEIELQPIIIEAISRIPNDKSEEFLINTFVNSWDIFIKITCLDSLSDFSSNLLIANDLYDSIDNYPSTIQTILIKTVYSIYERNKIQKTISEDLRSVSRKALLEDDPKINYYGLVSLGDIYFIEDIKSLVNLVFKDDYQTQKIILENLILFNSNDIIKMFLIEYFSLLYKVGSQIDLLSIIPMIVSNNPDSIQKLIQFQNIFIEVIVRENITFDDLIMDMMKSIDENNFQAQLINCNNGTYDE